METINQHQAAFFQSLKSAIPSYSSLVDKVAETLNISMDSAYRRIRGEKLIDFEEINLLCKKFNVSVDKLFSLNSNTIVFQGKQNTFQEDNFKNWLEDVLAQLEMVNTFQNKKIYYLLKDMAPWYHFYHPELASFKFFFWKKSILFQDSLKGAKFSISDQSHHGFEPLTQKILKTYNKIETTEIWNVEGMNTTLRQIDLYQEMGIIPNPQDTKRLYQCMLEVVDHLERMTESGKKFLPHQDPGMDSADYHFFVNEFVLGDNTFFVEIDGTRITYLNYGVIYFLGTADKSFNDGMFVNLENLIKKSTQISKVGEKERNQFFNKLRRKVQLRIDAMELKV
ncbi:hypothetical protein [Algoriphagus hitonicola]|uniref:BetR domain-containing protein n=1 Tax=Algoriphagus hitonicola TaxID=435880 RepID=A0A1I2RL84_9BACT|nr:hypothetical protein [Algoriphagus hitonicola]SFG41220.1 hypothetical protein SAMN04487988_103303 [Algoriphagus hitonicola]